MFQVPGAVVHQEYELELPAGCAHSKTGSGDYSLSFNAFAVPEQNDWRWCSSGGDPTCPVRRLWRTAALRWCPQRDPSRHGTHACPERIWTGLTTRSDPRVVVHAVAFHARPSAHPSARTNPLLRSPAYSGSSTPSQSVSTAAASSPRMGAPVPRRGGVRDRRRGEAAMRRWRPRLSLVS